MTTKKTETKAVSTEIQARPPLLTSMDRQVGAIIPKDIDQAFRIATAIQRAGMAPQSYKSADAILVGIMHGMEVGLTPMAALQSIAVINGMPTIWGDGALGLVRASGLLEDISETLEGEGEAAMAVCVCRRIGQKSEIRRTFSMADAKKANLAGKSGPWMQYPQRMMQMRARSWALRDGFADVLRGLGVKEEVEDMDLVRAADGSFVPAGRPLRQHYINQAEQNGGVAAPSTGEGLYPAEGEDETTTESEDVTEVEDEKAEVEKADAAYQFVDWEGEVHQMFGGQFADRMEAEIKTAKTVAVLDALWENNQAFMDQLQKESEQTVAWYEDLVRGTFDRKSELTPKAEPKKTEAEAKPATVAATPPAVAIGANGSVQLLELDGTVLQTYKRSTAFFDALKQLVARTAAADRQTVIDMHTAAAEYLIKQKAVNAKSFWAEVQAAAAKKVA